MEDIFGNVGGGGENPFGGGSDAGGGESPVMDGESDGGENPFGGGSDAGESDGGGNPFGSGSDAGESDGGGNPFGGGSDAGGAGGENPFGGGSDAGAGAGGASGGNPFGGGSNAGGGAPNSNANPDYDYDFSAFEPSGEAAPSETGESPVISDAGAGGENPFGGGSGAGGAGGGNSFGGGGGGNPFGGGSSSGGESPVMDGESDGGENPFGGGSNASGAGSGNPFANFNPLEEGNPLVEGDEPNISFGGAASGESDENLSIGAGSGAGGAGGFGGSTGGGNPFGGESSGLPDEGAFAIGDDNGYVVRDENGQWFISEDDVASEDDTSLTNPEIPGADSEGSGNPFGGNPDEFDPTADSPDSLGMPAGNTFPESEVPEGLSNEVVGGGAVPAEDSSSLEGSPIEFEYNHSWDFDFADSDSADLGSSLSDSDAPELEDGTPLLDETDFGSSPTGEENSDSSGETLYNTETNEIELPNGASIKPYNEAGEFDLSIDTPIVDENGLEVGDLNISFPEYVEDYFGSVFNSDGISEGFGFSESELADIGDDFNQFGADTPVLGEDNVLQLPGGFEFDLSEIAGDSGDSGDSVI